jgi:putative sterol carrier protein
MSSTLQPPFGVDSDKFAEMFREASEQELTSAMEGPYRDAILGEIFRQMPSRLRPDRARGVTGALQWRISGRPDGGEDIYEVAFADGACQVNREATMPPRATMKIDAVAFLKLIAQAVGPAKLVLTRRLRVRGDLPFAMRSEHLFRKPLDDD